MSKHVLKHVFTLSKYCFIRLQKNKNFLKKFKQKIKEKKIKKKIVKKAIGVSLILAHNKGPLSQSFNKFEVMLADVSGPRDQGTD